MSKLTRDFKETVQQRASQDNDFAVALFNEATTLFLNGEPEIARLVLRDLVNATVGFEELSKVTNRPSKSLHRMLSNRGNPTMENLTTIFKVLKEKLNVVISVEMISQPS